jgi:hypothetical protein
LKVEAALAATILGYSTVAACGNEGCGVVEGGGGEAAHKHIRMPRCERYNFRPLPLDLTPRSHESHLSSYQGPHVECMQRLGSMVQLRQAVPLVDATDQGGEHHRVSWQFVAVTHQMAAAVISSMLVRRSRGSAVGSCCSPCCSSTPGQVSDA